MGNRLLNIVGSVMLAAGAAGIPACTGVRTSSVYDNIDRTYQPERAEELKRVYRGLENDKTFDEKVRYFDENRQQVLSEINPKDFPHINFDKPTAQDKAAMIRLLELKASLLQKIHPNMFN